MNDCTALDCLRSALHTTDPRHRPAPPATCPVVIKAFQGQRRLKTAWGPTQEVPTTHSPTAWTLTT
jgi:hypothetical protein